jgi:hypothetical protein
MSAVAIIFNGLHFEPAVAARAFAHAKQANGNIIAIFLKSTDDEQSVIIESNVRLLEHQALTDKVDLHTQLLQTPSVEQFKSALDDAGLIYVQGFDEHGVNTPSGIDVKKLLDKVSIPIEIVPQ